MELFKWKPAAVETLQLQPIAVSDLLGRVFPAGRVQGRDFRGDQSLAVGPLDVLDEPRNGAQLGVAMGVEKQ